VPIAWLGALPTMSIALVARAMAALPAANLTWPGGTTADLMVTVVLVVVAGPRLLRLAWVEAFTVRAILGRWPP
jgi:competence protein ComEC